MNVQLETITAHENIRFNRKSYHKIVYLLQRFITGPQFFYQFYFFTVANVLRRAFM